jgi:putative tryptophan/tyrosine transport system substrate-binding protein
MRRRDVISLIGGGMIASLIRSHAALTQQADRHRRIGAMILTAQNDSNSHNRVAAFEQSLGKLGWKVGQNLQIDYRWDVAGPETAQTAATELLTLKPDLLLANSVSATKAAQQATSSVPIVFNGVSEPIRLGIVSDLAHPGGNITGFTNLEPSVGGKWLELIHEIAPQASQVAVMYNPMSTVIAPQFVDSIRAAASNTAMKVEETPVYEPPDIGAVLATLASNPEAALITLPDTFLGLHFKQIVELEKVHRLPAIHPFRYFVDAGSLASYGPDLVDQFRQCGIYVDRILKGAMPGDLPVQQPTKFEFIINLKAAKLLDLNVSASLIATADEVIE